jgi:hypothetical protein
MCPSPLALCKGRPHSLQSSASHEEGECVAGAAPRYGSVGEPGECGRRIDATRTERLAVRFKI